MIDGVNVRFVRPEERGALVRLAALDCGRAPFGAYLVAEVEGQLWAAVPLAGGRALADPFQPTTDLVQLLEVRAAQLRAAEAQRSQPRPRRLGFSLRRARRA